MRVRVRLDVRGPLSLGRVLLPRVLRTVARGLESTAPGTRSWEPSLGRFSEGFGDFSVQLPLFASHPLLGCLVKVLTLCQAVGLS